MDTNSTHVRWAIRRDGPYIVEIARQWHGRCQCHTEEKLYKLLAAKNVIGLVATRTSDPRPAGEENVVGYLVYGVYKSKYAIIDLAARRGDDEQEIFLKLADKMKGKLNNTRKKLVCQVSEYLTNIHLLLRAAGFKAAKVERGIGGAESYYHFIYRTERSDADATQVSSGPIHDDN